MHKPVIISADSTCDIGPEIQSRYDVKLFYFHIQVGEKTYLDQVEISSEEIFRIWRQEGVLPKTAAINLIDYSQYFEKWVAEGYEIVHINLGSGFSVSNQNCKLVAESLSSVYPVDSMSLSAGSGLLVLKACEMKEAGLSASEIQKELQELATKTNASFVLDTLEFMAAGGRCSSVLAFGANLLHLKPVIQVKNANGGSMDVGRKHRGPMEKVLKEYIKNRLESAKSLDLSQIFITSACSPESDIELVKTEILKYAPFQNIYVTDACSTISSHCGPRTLGILFLSQ